MPHRIEKKECSDAHKRVEKAATFFTEKQREKESVDKEARHAARNIRMLLGAILHRMERSRYDEQP